MTERFQCAICLDFCPETRRSELARKKGDDICDSCEERMDLATFRDAYVHAALFFSADEQDSPLIGYDQPNIHRDALTVMRADCARFFRENKADIANNLSQAGHDFWLTRNGHGAGFWDGDWPEPAATRLTKAAHSCGEYTLYVGDDGMIHGM